MEVVYVAGGCLWGVQAFFKTIPGMLNYPNQMLALHIRHNHRIHHSNLMLFH
jgi:peptide methionine sulfoxide reductase MsrA